MQIARRIALASTVAFAAGCALGEVHEVDREIEFEEPIDGATTVTLDVPVPVTIAGSAAFDVVRIEGTVTVATSSAPRSQELADALEVRVEREGARLLTALDVPGDGAGTPFPEATLRGSLNVQLPSGVTLEVIQRGGTTVVRGMSRGIDVRSAGPVQVAGAAGSVSVRCDNGPVEIDTAAAPGTRTFLGMVGGAEARVLLPAVLNARVVAQTADGTVYLGHPQLPRGPADPYVFTAGSGAAEVEVSVTRGNIVLQAR
jgi:hypothetical protein